MRKNKHLPAGAHAKAALPVPTSPLPRILVVDDAPYFCHRNAEVLIRRGYEVSAAEDGAAEWEDLQANRHHLLITENELPSLTGLKLVKKLRSARLALPVNMAAPSPQTRPSAIALRP